MCILLPDPMVRERYDGLEWMEMPVFHFVQFHSLGFTNFLSDE